MMECAEGGGSTECYILTPDRAVNQRSTCVNKRKKKRKQVGIMKEYRQMTAAVELVGQEGQSENQLAAVAPQMFGKHHPKYRSTSRTY